MALIIERVLKNKFDFTLDEGITISVHAPGLTVDGNYFHFKTKNGANIIKKQNITFPEVTIIDTYGGTGTFNSFVSINDLWQKLEDIDYFSGVNGSGSGSGVTRFDALLDGFQYFGNNGKIPVVDEAQLRLVATEFYNYNLLTQLNDVSISSLTSGKYLKTEVINGQIKIVLGDLNTSNTGDTLKKIEITAEGGESELPVDNSPNTIFLFKNGQWQIEGLDFTYIPGTITLLQSVNNEDYFEVIPLSNNANKQIINTDSDNQTVFNFNGNPVNADVYLRGSRLREGVDFTRTKFSINNNITIINQLLIDSIDTGDILELITY